MFDIVFCIFGGLKSSTPFHQTLGDCRGNPLYITWNAMYRDTSHRCSVLEHIHVSCPVLSVKESVA